MQYHESSCQNISISVLLVTVSLFIDFIAFVFFLIVGAYLPGRLFFRTLKIQLDALTALFLPFTTGLLLFTLLAYFLQYLHVPFLLVPLLLPVSIFSVFRYKLQFLSLEKKHTKPLLLTTFFILLFAAISYPTGIFGITLFYRHDDLWHLMLINEMTHRFPPNNPGFSAVVLHGYHFFFDFLLAQISKYFYVSVNSVYFRFFPLFLAYLWGIGVYAFSYVWSKKISVALWSVFLTMFGGSFAYGLLLQGHKGYSWDSGLGIAQPFSSLMNPPFTISITLLITGFFAIYYYFQTKKISWLTLLVLAAGLTPMFKVYGGIILMAGYCLVVGIELLRKNLKILYTLPFVAAFFFGTYWIFASGAGYLIWYPLWGPHTILQTFPWYNFDNKIYVYSTEHVIKGLIQTEVDGLTVFLLGNLGTRLIGLLLLLYFIFERKTKPSLFAAILFLLSLVGIGIPLFFLQSGKVFEIIQMSWYFLFIASFGASFGFAYFFEQKFSRILKTVLFVGLLILTLPSAYEVFMGLNQTLTYNPAKDIAIAFLAKDTNYAHTILELPPSTNPKDAQRWYTHQMPTLAALGNKQAYVANEFIDFTNVPVNKRVRQLAAFPTLHAKEAKTFLLTNHIFYIYSSIPQEKLLQISGVREVASDSSGVLYKFSN